MKAMSGHSSTDVLALVQEEEAVLRQRIEERETAIQRVKDQEEAMLRLLQSRLQYKTILFTGDLADEEVWGQDGFEMRSSRRSLTDERLVVVYIFRESPSSTRFHIYAEYEKAYQRHQSGGKVKFVLTPSRIERLEIVPSADPQPAA